MALLLSGCTDWAPDGVVSPLPNRGGATQSKVADVIVTLEPRTDPGRFARDNGIEPTHVYSHVLNGFAGRVSDLAREGLLRDARVRRVELDAVVTTTAIDVEAAATWGLDRIDQRLRPLDGTYGAGGTGAGVAVYIVDTGAWFTHAEFNDPSGAMEFRRIFPAFDVFNGEPRGYAADCNGHGTHVAGTVGGNTYGVAKGVRLFAVRVLDCGGVGTWSGVVAGLDWIVANAERPAVVNMSLGGPASQTIDDAVQRVIAAGITVVVAAGNSNADACLTSPARAANALTIGASDKTDARAWFSNWGGCVDLFAPGVDILSATFGSDTRTLLGSGTSMASPHAAGAAALLLEQSPAASPAEVADALEAATTKNAVTDAESVNAHLLYVLGDSDSGGGQTAPNAAFSVTCAGLACTFTDGSTDADGSIASWQWAFGDGTSSAERHPGHSYAVGGTYDVTLSVTDSDGMTSSATRVVTVSTTSDSNVAPTPEFTFQCVRLACDFVDGSSDPDGTITQRAWDFGDGAARVVATGGNLAHEFSTAGVYQVSLTVTDDDGAVASYSADVAVGLIASVQLQRVKGFNFVDVAWTGAQSTDVDIWINGQKTATVAGGGEYTYRSKDRGQASYAVEVCEAGSKAVCSPVVTVGG